MDFYDRVKTLAKNNGYLLTPFLQSLGINYESFKSARRLNILPRADEAVKIAKALGTTVEYLVEGDVLDTSNLEKTLEEVKRALAVIENSIADSKLR